jgi:hypothetical protein
MELVPAISGQWPTPGWFVNSFFEFSLGLEVEWIFINEPNDIP